MSIYGKLETGHTDGWHLLLRLDERGIKELHATMFRALNTWDPVARPKDISDLMVELDKVMDRLKARDEDSPSKYVR